MPFTSNLGSIMKDKEMTYEERLKHSDRITTSSDHTMHWAG